MPVENAPQIPKTEKRKILAKLLAEGNGVVDFNKISKGHNSGDVREYLALLPLGQAVTVDNSIFHVAESQGRPESTIPDEFKEYYKRIKNLPRVRTLN